MIMRNLDKNNDWTFGAGKSNYVSGIQAIQLDVRTAIYEWLNDCFFNMGAGIDWRNRLNRGQAAFLDRDLRSLILSRYGVVSIDSVNLDFNPNTRVFSVSYTLLTVFSQSIIDAITFGEL